MLRYAAHAAKRERVVFAFVARPRRAADAALMAPLIR
jgi:hypothetical protein